ADPDPLERYSLLSRTEQYFFLLQTTWCYLNWSRLCEARGWYVTEPVLQLLQLVSDHPPGRTFEILTSHSALRHENELIPLSSVSMLVQAFRFLGFFKVQPAVLTKKPDRYTFPFAKLTVAETGIILAPVLLTQRPLELWNAPLRRAHGEWGIPLGLTEDEYFPEDETGHLAPRPAETLVIPAFLPAFAPLFEPGELVESFYSDTPAFTPGRYELKVALDKKLYRTIAIGASATLDDLHLAIQDAFRFDNDHLYAFYMDGEAWSDDRFNAPGLEEPPFTTDAKLGELDLYAGRRFLYLFDFGDSWEFWVTVLQVDPAAPEPKSPKVVDKLGKNPKQYPDW
ncbi:MAG: plasmid pRiA4b ORF-3 family protein, partial [Cytophagales bacterium]|nr:plasmid pRiA4b ORF-3 family protein [Cytophagales bacterium]